MKYWVLKSREGRGGCDYWNCFLSEGVIAIGWNDIDVRPDGVSHEELVDSLRETYGYSERQATVAANTIRKFVEISIDDKVLLCRGYAPNQVKKVHLYGTALVTGPFEDHDSEGWSWRFRHKAKIDETFRPNGKDVPKEFLVQRLQSAKTKKPLKSLLQTLHEISKEGFERVIEDVGKS